MAEERTVSVISAINSARRNRQHVATIVDQVQIRQWYGYDPSKLDLQKQSRPSLRFSQLKQYRKPKYVVGAGGVGAEPESDDDDNEENHENVDGNKGLNDTLVAKDFSTATRQILGDTNPASRSLLGLLDSDSPAEEVVEIVGTSPSRQLKSGVSLVKDDDEYPEL